MTPAILLDGRRISRDTIVPELIDYTEGLAKGKDSHNDPVMESLVYHIFGVLIERHSRDELDAIIDAWWFDLVNHAYKDRDNKRVRFVS